MTAESYSKADRPEEGVARKTPQGAGPPVEAVEVE